MLVSQLAARYAHAIFELASDKKIIDAVERELLLITEAMNESKDLASLLCHPQVPAEVKKDTVVKLFSSDLSEYVRNFLFLLFDRRRETALLAIVEEFRTLANRARNIIEAEVTTAMPLAQDQEKGLSEKLSVVTGKNVILKTQVDKRILGGVIVKIGDKLIDGSVERQLKTLKAALLKTEVTKIGVTN
ncbi:MAG: synthase subunit delta [Firmicutes bacterium]|nr:synthase subunit delta [Bacillota bacterium]